MTGPPGDVIQPIAHSLRIFDVELVTAWSPYIPPPPGTPLPSSLSPLPQLGQRLPLQVSLHLPIPAWVRWAQTGSWGACPQLYALLNKCWGHRNPLNSPFPIFCLESGMAVGIQCVCACAESVWNTHCAEVCWNTREDWGDCRSHDKSGTFNVVLFPQWSHDCLSCNCPCLRAFRADCDHRQIGCKSFYSD